jgi:transcriptional regulator with XRE-family HTH domain
LGLSQEKLAEVAGLSAQTISDIEGCRTWVSDKTLLRLAEVLNVDIFQLLLPMMSKTGEHGDPILQVRVDELRQSIKDDVDKRVDQFFS